MIQGRLLPLPKVSDAEKDRLMERLEAQIYDFCLDSSSRSTDGANIELNRHFVLQYFLERNHYDVDKTMEFYEAYSKWRKEMISFKPEDDEHAEDGYQPTDTFAKWVGVDRKNRPCCFIKGCQFHPRIHRKHAGQFQKFVVETFELGCMLAQGCDSRQIGIVYDRRNMHWDNIDVHLYQKTHKCWHNLRNYYSHWIGTLYIVHVNWFLWILYVYIARPILKWLRMSQDIIVLREAKDILEYIDEEHLPQGFLDDVKGEKESTNYIDVESGKDAFTQRVTPPPSPMNRGNATLRSRQLTPPASPGKSLGRHHAEADEAECLLGNAGCKDHTISNNDSTSSSWFSMPESSKGD